MDKLNTIGIVSCILAILLRAKFIGISVFMNDFSTDRNFFLSSSSPRG
jgi:hypothetical protein